MYDLYCTLTDIIYRLILIICWSISAAHVDDHTAPL